MAGEVRVRAMTGSDIPWAVALTDKEGWSYSPQDFERLLALEPGGILLVEAGGVPAGITATMSYGPLAYLGTVIVEPPWRRRGVGTALMNACLDRLESQGAESVRLNAYGGTVAYYERFGFRREFENAQFQGDAEGWSPPGVRLAREDDLEAIAPLDLRYFGADRTRLLSRLLAEFPDTFLVADDGGEVVAYAVGNTSAAACEVGPFVCPPERASLAESLLHALFGVVDASCAFSLPRPNVVGVEAAKRAGLGQAFSTIRMVRGSSAHGGDPRGIFALGGLEKG